MVTTMPIVSILIVFSLAAFLGHHARAGAIFLLVAGTAALLMGGGPQ